MKEWFKARNIWYGAFAALTDAEAGRLAKALWAYTMMGEEVELSGNEKGCFAMIKFTLQQDEAEASNLSETRRKAGLAGVEAKQANADFAKNEEAKQANADNKNKNKNKEKEKDIKSAIALSANANRDFEKFWSVYPRHEGKQAARKTFEKLNPDDALLSTIINAIAKQKQSAQWSEARYIPHPATWLNGRRWEDEPTKDLGKRVRAQMYEQREYDEEEERRTLGVDDLFISDDEYFKRYGHARE